MDALNKLRNPDLARACAIIAPADVLFPFLSARPEVLELRNAISQGSITSAHIEAFTETLLSAFERGKRLPGDVALAAVAAALASVPDGAAGRYLRGLASARVLELPFSPRVAVLALKSRAQRFGQVLFRKRTVTPMIPRPDQPVAELKPTPWVPTLEIPTRAVHFAQIA